MKKAAIILVLIGLLAAGYIAYDSVLGPTKPASGPIEAVPLPAPETAAQSTPEETQASGQPDTPAPTPAAPIALRTFRINPDESTVQFVIYEELRGSPVNVVGTTNQVAGQVAFNPEDMRYANLGVIQVNARTLRTDNDRRNQAIRNRILNTDAHEYITFTPRQINGLVGNIQVGVPLRFSIGGDLQIRDVTRPAVFEALVTPESDDRMRVRAGTRIRRGDFDLVVPNLPFLANVGEDVTLEINAVIVPVPEQ